MKNVHSNVLYCEPNDLFNYDPNGKNISLTPDLEDYCITVDLEVEIPGRMKGTKVKNGNDVFIMRWVNGTKSGDNKISFLQGTRYTYEGSKGSSFLTTAAYDFATYDDVWKTQDPNGDGNIINSTNELFGINSIDIEYNNYMVPIVTINFTDIRGISLFAPEEIRHRMTYVNGDSATHGFADKDIAGSFFKSFFTFPYPKFRLSVKGFYGEPTTYELSCSDFRARFDSETGNFGATAKFVGYSYSLLGDVTLSALVAAPYETSCGKGYWLDKVNEGVFTFDDGKPMITLLDILTKSNDIMINLDKLSKTDPIYDNLKNYDDNSKLLAEIEVSFSDYVSSILNANTPIEGSIKSNADTNQAYYFKIEGDIIDNNTINTRKQSLEEKVVKYSKFASRYSSIDFIEKEEGVTKFDASEFYGALVQEKNNLTQNIEDANKEIGVKSRQIIGDVLGFSPTVENITNVLLAHLETFLRCIYNTTEQVSGRTPQSTGVYTHGFNIGPNEVLPPFPKYTTIVSENYHNIKREEDGWIGDLENKLVEQKLIEGLLKGIEDIESVLDKVTESFENFKQSNMAVKIPTTITDLLIEDGPFKGDLNEGDIEDLFGRLAVRMSLILGLNGKSEADSNLAKTLGKADAHNFFISHPNIGEKLSTLMKSGTIGNDAWESLNKQHINEDVVWEREGSDLPWFSKTSKIHRLSVDANTQALRLDGFYWEELRKDIEGKGYIEHIDHYIIDKDIKTSPINNPNILNILNEGELNNLLTKVQVLQEGDWSDIANSKMFTSLINWDISNYETTYLKHDFKNTLKGKFIQEVESETTLYPSILPTNTNVKNISYNPTNVIIEKDNKIKVVIKGKDGNELKQPWVDQDGRLHNPGGKTWDKKVKITDKDSGHTIWSFERNGKCLFGDPTFYTYDKYIQGLLFLDQWNWGQSISKFLKGSVNIDILPKYAVLYMGGCLYALKEGKDLKSLNLKATVTTITTSSSLFGPSQQAEITDVLTPISSLRGDIQSILINYFKEWIEKDNGYTLIHGTYAFDDGDDVKSLKTFFAEEKGHEDVISDLKEIWSEEKINKLLKAYLTVVSRTEELRLINRNSSLIDSIIEDAQSPCVLIHPILDVTNSDHTFAVDQGCAKKYLEGFQSEIKILYEGLENSTSEDATSSTNDQKDIKIALYNYIKILWDRWLSGDAEGWKTWGLENFKKHWYYIDSYYNDVGQDNFINLESFMKDITSSLKTQGYSLLSYLFTMYARERFNLFCVQNFLGMVNEEKMKRMFDPIPFNEVAFDDKTYIPDFVAMYTGEFSSKLDMEGADQVGDSYLIATEKYEELPIAIREKVIGKNGHRIPAFGVSFGRQYQHYFKTYEISMDSPVVTEQALKAKFMLANINSSDNSGESGRNAIHISPDLYTIYSNNSYSCNIQMMGCAWIQPLMYFQLNNVPMFRGTYLIQKVTHRIVPGDMTTTFMGTRMAKTTTPIVKDPIASKNAGQTEPFTEDAKKNKEHENASINNDCEYKFFALNVTDGGIDDELLYQKATSVSPQHLGKHTNKDLYSNCSLLDVLAASAYGAVGGGDKLAVQLTATVHYNRYMKCGDFDSSQFFVHNQIEFDTNLALDFLRMDKSSETRKNVTEWVKEIYSSSPAVLVGQSTTVKNKSITLKGNDANIQTKSKVLTLSDLQRMNGYATAEENGYFAWMNGAGGVDPSKIHYICQHEWDRGWSHVFVSFNNNEILWNKSNTKTNSTRSYDDIMSQLYSSIQSTMLYSSNIKANANNVLTYSKVSDGVYDLKDKSGTQASSVLAQVYDIVINAYSDYVKNAYWIVPNESPLDFPDRVRVELGIGSNIHTFAMATFKNSEPNIIREFRYWTDDEGDSAWDINSDFCKCLQKKYDSITEANIIEFVKDCPNFSYYLTKHEAIEEAVKEINSILNEELKSCDELMETIGNAPSEGFSWMGHTDNSLYELTPQKNKLNNYKKNKALEYLKEHEQPSGGHCAEYVRKALQSADINCDVRPNSACCYEKFLPVWGFDLVATLEKGQPTSYTPQRGDIAVSQSSPSHKHGHIQIYDDDTNKWWADVPYNNADPYSEWGRLTNIYRWPEV